VFAAVAICATTIKDVPRLSQLSMTATAGAFVSNVASRAHTRTAFAQNATCGTIGAVIGCFAPVQFVASRFSHHDATLSIAHGLASYGRAALLSLRNKVREAPSPSRALWCARMAEKDARAGPARGLAKVTFPLYRQPNARFGV
jgi:hypothetical protein